MTEKTRLKDVFHFEDEGTLQAIAEDARADRAVRSPCTRGVDHEIRLGLADHH